MATLSTKKLAIAHGANLSNNPDAPKTLTEVLQGITADTGKIVILESDGRKIVQTYTELRERATKMLAGLRDFGLYPGNHIILQVDRPDFVATFWSCILGGFVPIPISIAPSYQEPNKTLTKLHDVWHLLDNPTIVTTEALAPEICGSFVGSEVKILTIETIETYASDTQWFPSKPDDFAYFLLTSGTTGKPKLITHTHRGAVSRFFPPKKNESPEDTKRTYLSWLPFDHMAGLRIAIPNVDCQINLSTAVFLRNPSLWLDAIEEHRVTHTVMLNFALRLIIERVDKVPQRLWDLSSIKEILVGAEPIVAKTARCFLKRLASHGLSSNVFCPVYGMSENAVLTISQEFSLNTTDDDDPFVMVGYPTANHSIRIVDERGNLLEEGQIGSIEVCGPTMSPGYYENPQANNSAFTPDGWFRTGDLGFLNNQRLTVTGRKKEIIIINGVNYYSHQIEKVVEEIEGIIPTLTAACAVRQANSDTDELVIFFHTSALEPSVISQILGNIRKNVASQLGVNPSYLIPLEKSQVPKTGTGKIQRLELKKKFEAGEFDSVHQKIEAFSSAKFVVPYTNIQEVLSTIWSEVLGVQVGIDDNFFELGGDSLQVAQIVSRIQKAFNVYLPNSTLLKSPTIKQLEQTITKLNENQPKIIDYEQEKLVSKTKSGSYQESWWGENGEYPLSPELEFFWIVSQMFTADSFLPKNSIQKLSNWNCEFNSILLERACNLLVERNEVLRTCLTRKKSKFIQILNKLFTVTSIEDKNHSSLKRLEKIVFALLQKPNSIAAKLIHLLLSFKINSELSLVRQKILPPQPVKVTYYDYKNLTNETILATKIEEVAILEKQYSFDMQKGPLVRCAVILNPNNTLTVIVTVHHGFVDLIGVTKTAEELYKIYQALLENNYHSLKCPPQYRHYATHCASLKNSASYKADISYWKKHLAKSNPITIPPKPGSVSREDFHLYDSIDKEIGTLINSYCQKNNLLVSAFFLAGYYLLLHQITKETNLTVLANNGTPPDSDSQETIGNFLQSFPVVIDLQKTPTNHDLIQACANNIFGLLEHRIVSLPRLTAYDICIAASVMKLPACVFQVIQVDEVPLPNRRVPSSLINTPGCRFDILVHGSSNYSLKVNYDLAFYEHEYIESLTNKYQDILANIVQNPQQDALSRQ